MPHAQTIVLERTPSHSIDQPEDEQHDFSWALAGNGGLRAGWSVLMFVALYYLLMPLLSMVAVSIDPDLADRSYRPINILIGELVPLTSILIAGFFMSQVEHRHIVEYNLSDAHWLRHLFRGALAGFAALSLLVGVLVLGGWAHFGSHSLGGLHILKYAAIWGIAFLLVALFEEGSFRCYLQSTLTRGINFWWALVAVLGTCAALLLRAQPRGVNGVYLVASLGLAACSILRWKQSTPSSFWYAAWATSTAFGAFHSGNPGETSVGIFSAALIGFIFCVSVRLTQSAWWAIGCHASWDWAQTFFYGTPDSGLPARGHLFTTTSIGNPLWSGGIAGPEGSVLAVPIALLLLILLVAFHRPQRSAAIPMPATERQAS